MARTSTAMVRAGAPQAVVVTRPAVRRSSAALTTAKGTAEKAISRARKVTAELRATKSPEAALLPAAYATGGGALVGLYDNYMKTDKIFGFDSALSMSFILAAAGWVAEEPALVHAAGGAGAVWAYKQTLEIKLPAKKD